MELLGGAVADGGDEFIYPLPTTDIEEGDILLLYVDSSDVRHVEKILS